MIDLICTAQSSCEERKREKYDMKNNCQEWDSSQKIQIRTQALYRLS